MRTLRRFCARRRLGLCLGFALAPLASIRGQTPADTAGAAEAIRDYLAAATRDGGRLWGRPLAGPIILVDPDTRAAVASEQPPGGVFEPVNGTWRGTIPSGIPTANFALTWADRRWAMVLLPLPADRFGRLSLLLHESFHGIQPDLSLSVPDYLNPHLDERDGRFWLRLELRAMAAALRSDGVARENAARDALLFRAQRVALYPGADTLERALELAEGLAEYTGTRLALDQLGLPLSRAAEPLERFEVRKTYVRSLGYGTGPGLGLLLDQYAPGWRSRAGREGLAGQLAAALRFVVPQDLPARAGVAAARYGAEALGREEDARADARARLVADYRRRLVVGPVLSLRQRGLQRGFNPNELVAMGAEGTVYPTGTFRAEWGSLEVDRGGALVAPDFTLLRLPAPRDATGSVVRGEGWLLRLAEGWRLAPGERAGDWVAVPGQ